MGIIGKPHPHKGIPCSEEKKLKISLSLMGRHLPENIKQKISNSLKGRKWPEERKVKRRTGIFVPCNICGKMVYITSQRIKFKNHFCSATCQGIGFRGRKVSEKQKKQISDTLRRKHIITKGSWKKGNIPWNKNLTKEIDKRVKKSGLSRKRYIEEHPKECQRMKFLRLNRIFPRISSIEQKLKLEFEKQNIVFKTQIPIHFINKKYCITDFFFPSSKIVVFCDGDYWHNLENTKKKDKEQNKFLHQMGFKVLRFWEHEIKSSPEKCASIVMEELQSARLGMGQT